MQFIDKLWIVPWSIAAFLGLGLNTMAQDFVSLKAGMGKMMILENERPLNDRIPQVEFSYARSYEGREKPWTEAVRAKYQILSLTYFNQQDLDGFNDTSANAFGDFYGLSYAVLIEPFKGKRQHFYLVPGWGLGYDTKTYYQDPSNVHVGTHLNYVIRLELMHQVMITKTWIISHGLRYYHYSNGAFVLPNRGINTFTYQVGADFHFKKKGT